MSVTLASAPGSKVKTDRVTNSTQKVTRGQVLIIAQTSPDVDYIYFHVVLKTPNDHVERCVRGGLTLKVTRSLTPCQQLSTSRRGPYSNALQENTDSGNALQENIDNSNEPFQCNSVTTHLLLSSTHLRRTLTVV